MLAHSLALVLALTLAPLAVAEADGDDLVAIMTSAVAQDSSTALERLRDYKRKAPASFNEMVSPILTIVTQGGIDCSPEIAKYLVENGAVVSPATPADLIGIVLCPGVIEGSYRAASGDETRGFYLKHGLTAASIHYVGASALFQIGGADSKEEYLSRTRRGHKIKARSGEVFAFLAKEAKQLCKKSKKSCGEAAEFDRVFAELKKEYEGKVASIKKNPALRSKPEQVKTIVDLLDSHWNSFAKPYPK